MMEWNMEITQAIPVSVCPVVQFVWVWMMFGTRPTIFLSSLLKKNNMHDTILSLLVPFIPVSDSYLNTCVSLRLSIWVSKTHLSSDCMLLKPASVWFLMCLWPLIRKNMITRWIWEEYRDIKPHQSVNQSVSQSDSWAVSQLINQCQSVN